MPVPRLTELCIRVLQSNVHQIQDVGDIPYEMLREVLPGCRVEQLREIEEVSPQIADEDDEIWETFFKRDFPLVAEARQATIDKLSAPPSSSAGGEAVSNYEDLFSTYRDLYYEAEVARDEKLALAGSRLKEKIATLRQKKQERSVVLDPKLGLNPKLNRRSKISPIKTRWSQQQSSARPKTLMEKARAKAGAVAYAYHPPKFTRSSMRIACMASIPSKPKLNYKEVDSNDDITTAISSHSGKAVNTGKGKGTHFVERTVAVKSKATPQKPFKDAAGPVLSHAQHIGILDGSIKPVPTSNAVACPPKLSAQHAQTAKPADEPVPVAAPRPIKNIPGITRRPKPANYDKHLGPPPFTSDAPSPSSSSATSHLSPPYIPSPIESAASPPNWSHVVAQLSPPASTSSSSFYDPPPSTTSASATTKKPKPSLFIPRKRPKV